MIKKQEKIFKKQEENMLLKDSMNFKKGSFYFDFLEKYIKHTKTVDSFANIIEEIKNISSNTNLDDEKLKENVTYYIQNKLIDLYKNEIILLYFEIREHVESIRLRYQTKDKQTEILLGSVFSLGRFEELLEAAITILGITLHVPDKKFKNKVSILENKMTNKKKQRKRAIKTYLDIFMSALVYINLVNNGHLINCDKKLGTKDIFELLSFNLGNKRDNDDRYFNEYCKQIEYEKPELHKFYNDETEEYVEEKGLTLSAIYSDISNDFKECLGFTHHDLSRLEEFLIQITKGNINRFNKCLIMALDEETLINNLLEYGLEKSVIKKLLEYFCINNINKITALDLEKINRVLDFKFIYKSEDALLIGIYSSLQSIHIFKLISLTDHYVEYLGLPQRIANALKSIHEKISELMCYYLADKLDYSKYKLPRLSENSSIPYVNINAIKNSEGKNVGFSDIDILALDEDKKEILNIEVKHLKVGLNYKEVFKRKVNKRYYDSTLRRHELIENNLEDILRQLFNLENIKDINKYKIKSIVVSSRPLYFDINYKSEGNKIKYYTWNTFVEKIKNKSL